MTKTTTALPVLLSRVLGQLTAEAETPELPTLAFWANVLRPVAEAGPDGLSQKALPEAARISKRAAVAAVNGAARRGLVTADGGVVRLTDAGRQAAQQWPSRLAALDEKWNGTPLRKALHGLVAQLPFELPHFPAGYGTADPSAIGGPAMQRAKKNDGLPAHGTDWKPVRRGDGDTVSGLPVTALLAQALTAFTIDYEDAFPWPLSNTLTVLCHLSAEPRPLADIPGDHGITGAGKSMVERHGAVTVQGKAAALTGPGQAVVQRHPERMAAVEQQWRERYGDQAVDNLRAALEPLAATAGDQPDYVLGVLF